MQKVNKLLVAGLFLIMVLGIGLGTKAVITYGINKINKTNNAEIPNGMVYERSTMVDVCVDGAMSTKTVNINEANEYCGCVIDDGLSTMGYDKFIQVMTELGNNNTITPEVNTIINKCLKGVDYQ
jgi:hypothetical protein